MLRIAIVSDRAEQLNAALRPRLPGDVTVECYAGVGTPSSALLSAEVVLGAPDLLPPMLPEFSRLRWVQSTWAGVTRLIDCPHRGYLLSGVKDIFGRSMAEYVLGWALAIKRSLLRHAVAEHWDSTPDAGLANLRLGIAGVGSIGSEVARRCAPFFAEVRGLNRDGRAVEGCNTCYGSDARLQFARNLDVLVLLLPHTLATKALADADLLDALAPRALLINGGRANALDMSAALTRLENGRLEAMVLDVLEREPLPEEDPLWAVPGLYLSSHTAAPTGIDAISELFLDNLRRYRGGEFPTGLIDFDRGY